MRTFAQQPKMTPQTTPERSVVPSRAALGKSLR
jgi:hypothetical protein